MEDIDWTGMNWTNMSAEDDFLRWLGESPDDWLCKYMMPYMTIKVVIVLGVGSAVAFTSMVQNAIVAFLFFRRRLFRDSHLLFLAFLALCDIVLAVAYVLLMSLQILFELLHSRGLSGVWHVCLRPFFAASNVARATSSFLLISATLERLLFIKQIYGLRQRMDQRFRVLVVGLCFTLGLFFNASSFFELTSNPTNCTNHNFKLAAPSPLSLNPTYRTVWMIWTRNFATIFLPFLLLVCLNLAVIRALRAQHKKTISNSLEHQNSMNMPVLPLSPILHRRETQLPRDLNGEITRTLLPSAHYHSHEDLVLRRSVRTASRMLLAIVGGYLCSNSLNVILTLWEHSGGSETLRKNYPLFYSVGADVISLSAIFSGMLRLQIYSWCDKTFWEDLKLLPQSLGCLSRVSTLGHSQRGDSELTVASPGLSNERQIPLWTRPLQTNGHLFIPKLRLDYSTDISI